MDPIQLHSLPRLDIRCLEQKDIAQYRSLLDLCFAVPVGMHYLDDFPVWDLSINTPTTCRLGVLQESRLVASAAVRLASLKREGTAPLLVAIIGAVVTHPDWRKRGFASQLVSQLTSWSQQKGADLALLWSKDSEFYKRLGFQFLGEQIYLPLTEGLKQETSSLSRVEKESVRCGWRSEIFHLMQKREDGLVLKSEDYFWMSAHKNVQWYSYIEGNKPISYVAMGRGIDLQNMIHEWGGDLHGISSIFKFLSEKFPQTFLLGDQKQFEKIQISFQSGVRDPLCMAKKLKALEYPKGLWIWGLDAA